MFIKDTDSVHGAPRCYCTSAATNTATVPTTTICAVAATQAIVGTTNTAVVALNLEHFQS